MRIAIVTQHGSPLTPSKDPYADAGAAGLTSLARALAARGHRVTIYARRDSRHLPDHAIVSRGVTIEHLSAGPPSPLAADRLTAHIKDFGGKLARRWAQRCPDIAHAYTWTSGLAALAAARGKRVRVVVSFGSPAGTERHDRSCAGADAARLRLEPCIARSADHVLAGTATEEAELVRMGVPRASITVVPSAVDTALFSPEGASAERTQRPRLLAVSPLEPGRGLDQLIRALAGIPEAELVIAGGPPKSTLRTDRVYRELMRLARNLKVQRRVAFTGQIRYAELPSLLRSADLLVSAAPREPLGAITIAAMACGTPVAVAAVGGNLDAVVDETTGLLTEPGRPDLLARLMRQLLATPMRLEAFGIAAADRATARYAADRIGREAAAVYQRLLAPAEKTGVPAQAATDPDEDLAAEPAHALVTALA
jgi:D-inositol-3-phosphate glycosyltransferase